MTYHSNLTKATQGNLGGFLFEDMSCKKKKYDKIGAMWALVKCMRSRNRFHNLKRQERRMYYCKECYAWHLTHLD
jgi:hypothetical protein